MQAKPIRNSPTKSADEPDFKAVDGSVNIDDSQIVSVDVPCANGIIHVVDDVILPVQESVLGLLRQEEDFSILVDLLEATGLDLPVASSSAFTVFAPTNAAWKASDYAGITEDPTDEQRERIFAVLARHVITGKHVSENALPYAKLRTIHGAPIYLTRYRGGPEINGIPISSSDSEAFNGLVNRIDQVIPDMMELPEGDISTIDAIKFVQETLIEGAKLYDVGEFEDSWRYYERRGYEFIDKYQSLVNIKYLRNAIVDDQPIFQFAAQSWESRNGFRNVLRELEKREDSVQDNFLMQRPTVEVFGR
ncbi:MAG: fasciclin domain-containing protein [Planctomycetota bacterium]